MTSSLQDLTNVQGDILLDGLPKEVETFWFFDIVDATKFCKNLRVVANREISSTQDVREKRGEIKAFKQQGKAVGGLQVPTVGANISFSAKGLKKISPVVGLNLTTNDQDFEAGMRATAVDKLADPKSPMGSDPIWDPEWHGHEIHGVLLVAGNTPALVKEKLDRIIKLFDGSIKLAFKLDGQVRPGEQKGHEHFGYKDGVSQPAISNIPNLTQDEAFVPPGQDTIDQGVILCGRPGDTQASTRQPWMVDGSFLAFRKLKQNVQDWDKFLVDSSNILGTFSDQLGARLIGRWKSGCPVNLQAEFDDKNIGNDPLRNNAFNFDPTGLNTASTFPHTEGSRLLCPIGAHIRKTNPRTDQPPLGRPSVHPHRILRRGIPYGPEISTSPLAERGLLVACYQSSLSAGFTFLQQFWANNTSFRFDGAGLDAVMGQTNGVEEVEMLGLKP
ncbi:unnamed protein product [Zymoseptoria tritici ST99CH_3D1]|nr:unnamed protein product [Zymoseptoria tritici ST99CH_3D1]